MQDALSYKMITNDSSVMQISSRTRRVFIIFAMFLSGALNGQVTFTVTGFATGLSPLGYMEGQSVSFSFTTSQHYPRNESSTFDSTGNLWKENTVTDGQLWSAITGTALSGSYNRPTNEDDYLASNLYVFRRNIFLFAGSDESATDTGLFTIPGQYIIGFELELGNVTQFSFIQEHLDPENYFTDYAGTYSDLNGRLRFYTDSSSAYFDITGLEISSAQIPEPSFFAAAAGGLALMLTSFCRKRREYLLSRWS